MNQLHLESYLILLFHNEPGRINNPNATKTDIIEFLKIIIVIALLKIIIIIRCLEIKSLGPDVLTLNK